MVLLGQWNGDDALRFAVDRIAETEAGLFVLVAAIVVCMAALAWSHRRGAERRR